MDKSFCHKEYQHVGNVFLGLTDGQFWATFLTDDLHFLWPIRGLHKINILYLTDLHSNSCTIFLCSVGWNAIFTARLSN
jgi:hypothetical protein